MKMHWGRRPGAPAALPTGGAERAARMRHFLLRLLELQLEAEYGTAVGMGNIPLA